DPNERIRAAHADVLWMCRTGLVTSCLPDRARRTSRHMQMPIPSFRPLTAAASIVPSIASCERRSSWHTSNVLRHIRRGDIVSAVLEETITDPTLERARTVAAAQGLRYAGSVPPIDAWRLARSGQAVLVDVRSGEERKFVGH